MRICRRELLRACGVVAVAGASGCLAANAEPDGTGSTTRTPSTHPASTQSTAPSSTTSSSTEPTTDREFWELGFLNQLDEERTVAVRVASGDETVFETAVTVAASENASVPDAIPAYDTETVEYEISVRTGEREAARVVAVDRSFQGAVVKLQPEQIRIIDYTR